MQRCKKARIEAAEKTSRRGRGVVWLAWLVRAHGKWLVGGVSGWA